MGDELALARHRAPRRQHPKLYLFLNSVMIAMILYIAAGLGTFAWSFVQASGAKACGDGAERCQSMAISVGGTAALWPTYWAPIVAEKIESVMAGAAAVTANPVAEGEE